MEELYVTEGVFSNIKPNPYQRIFSFRFLEPLYQKYGTDLYFIARHCRCLASGGSRVLDIGCGIGRLLCWFHAINPDNDVMSLNGIDIDPKAKRNAIPLVRDRIIIDDFLTHEFQGEFDVITMRFVIEHLLDFRSYLDKAVDLLKPHGVLFISTPDIDSPQAQMLKDKWKLINDPEQRIGHVRWFNRQSVRYLAAEMGLRVAMCTNRGEVLYHLPPSIQTLLRSVLGIDPVSGRFIQHYTPRIIYATLFDGLLSQTLGWGDGLYAFMTKS